jgi:hypothetical protein
LTPQRLPPDEQVTIESLLRELDHSWTKVDRVGQCARQVALAEPAAQRRMTVSGVDKTGTSRLVAAIGEGEQGAVTAQI